MRIWKTAQLPLHSLLATSNARRSSRNWQHSAPVSPASWHEILAGRTTATIVRKQLMNPPSPPGVSPGRSKPPFMRQYADGEPIADCTSWITPSTLGKRRLNRFLVVPAQAGIQKIPEITGFPPAREGRQTYKFDLIGVSLDSAPRSMHAANPTARASIYCPKQEINDLAPAQFQNSLPIPITLQHSQPE